MGVENWSGWCTLKYSMTALLEYLDELEGYKAPIEQELQPSLSLHAHANVCLSIIHYRIVDLRDQWLKIDAGSNKNEELNNDRFIRIVAKEWNVIVLAVYMLIIKPLEL